MLNVDDPLCRKFITNLAPSKIKHGFCRCGCGLKTTFPRQGEIARGYKRGVQVDYYPQHNPSGRGDRPFYRVDKKTGCWIWLGSLSDDGYPASVRVRRKTYRAHILYYRLIIGDIPTGASLDHTCRNRKCVNPSHLEPVTHTENVRRGLATKLNIASVRKIRSLHKEGRGGYRTIAKQFGITGPQVYKIVRGISWADHL